MADGSKEHKSRHALRNYFIASSAVALAVGMALALANKAPPDALPAYSPLAAIAICVVGLSLLAITTVIYIRRTDEHDLHANLWGLSCGLLTIWVLAPSWWLLNRSGIVAPVDFTIVGQASAIVATAVWLWLRFR